MTVVAAWARQGLAAALSLCAPFALGLEATISAQYLGGGSGRFDNTTPPARLCQHWASLCNGTSTVEIPISYVKRSRQDAADLRDRFYLQFPGRREVDVYHDQTGESRRMTFQFESISQKTVSRNVSYSPNMGSISGGCNGWTTLTSHSTNTIRFHTGVVQPSAPTPCWTRYSWAPAGHVDVSEITEMGMSYALDIPPPYRLRAGIYRGSVTYSIGPGGDFDFGNGVTALSGDSLTLSFVLDVQHAFVFEFAQGSERAVLEPKGGWSAWLAGRGAPQGLYRDLPFRLWSTGPFKVYKLCQHYARAGCGIRNGSGHEVPVEVALSLPAGIQHRGGSVQRLALPSGRAAALEFESVMPTLNRPGLLHFAVGRDDVTGMLAYPGSTYSGLATVVFDAEP
ncbi:hypothetical protein [Pseudomonas entomophila]|uniref:hypothetical protein n=1 Tax=Pseudomonas entomophila TaxID=312306 RepID=UPI001F00B892|nr:hypothetical protein [Pseudomonas entomophila]MCG8295003.1 hypothetical protein [Pseudomonas entomophila]